MKKFLIAALVTTGLLFIINPSVSAFSTNSGNTFTGYGDCNHQQSGGGICYNEARADNKSCYNVSAQTYYTVRGTVYERHSDTGYSWAQANSSGPSMYENTARFGGNDYSGDSYSYITAHN